MWAALFESFAEAFGLTRRLRPGIFALVIGASLGFTALAIAEGGPRGLVALGLVLGITAWSAWQVLSARDALWRSARAPLASPDRVPRPVLDDLPPTALALRRLACALDQARRGRYLEASQILDRVDRARLRADEDRLYEAALALVSLSLGDLQRAAVQAQRAVPTGSDELDTQLGRALLSDAWSDAARLRVIDEAWAGRGVEPGTRLPLPRLRALLRLRIDTSSIEGIEPWQAKALADEARAIGDEALAVDLESRVRPAAYR